MSTVALEQFSSFRFPGANPSLKQFVNAVKAPRPRYAVSCKHAFSFPVQTGKNDESVPLDPEGVGDLENGQSVLFLSSSFGRPAESFPVRSSVIRPPVSLNPHSGFSSTIPGYSLPLPAQSCLLSVPCYNNYFTLDPSSAEKLVKYVPNLAAVHQLLDRINSGLRRHSNIFSGFTATFVMFTLCCAGFSSLRFWPFISNHILYASLFAGTIAVACLFFYGLLRILSRNVTSKWLREIVAEENSLYFQPLGIFLVLHRSAGVQYLQFVELGKGSSFKPYVKDNGRV